MVSEFTARHVLTIYVLAYENSDCVRALLASLLPLDEPNVCVVVADNSDKTYAVREVVSEMIPSFDGRLLHHSYGCNIGMGTALRPFEIVKSPYLWMVGACNSFRPGALKAIIPVLRERKPDVLLHAENNLWRRSWVQVEQRYDTISGLIQAHSHSIACSINSMIHSTEKLRPLIPVGYETLSSLVPHAAMIYEGLRTRRLEVLYLPLMVFDRHARPRAWSMLQYMENMHCLFPAITPQADREAFFRELPQTDAWITEEIRKLKENPAREASWAHATIRPST